MEEETEYHLGVGGLARTACGDITHADSRHFASAYFEYALVVQKMPQLERKIIWCKNDLLQHRSQRYKKIEKNHISASA
jgi:hypothetical protein